MGGWVEVRKFGCARDRECVCDEWVSECVRETKSDRVCICERECVREIKIECLCVCARESVCVCLSVYETGSSAC